jgi:methylase of polypeptide subunit release factors
MTYQKLVDVDVLSHREVGALLHNTLERSFTAPFSFLDIACGDASQMWALAGTKTRHYHGVDLSESALELAANNLKDMPWRSSLTIAISSRSRGGRSPPTSRGAACRSITSTRRASFA